MKQVTTSCLLLLLIMASCQHKKEVTWFTGTISYAYTFESDSLDADSLAAIRPSKSDFRYDTTGYQSRFIARDTETYYYSGLTNKGVSETNSRQNYACEDYSIITDSILSWKIYDTEEKVLGHPCRVLEMQKGNSWVKYYVSTEMKVAPDTYKRHRSYNWDEYGKYAEGGLILRSEHRFRAFTMKGIATAVKKEDPGFIALELDKKKFNEVCNER